MFQPPVNCERVDRVGLEGQQLRSLFVAEYVPPRTVSGMAGGPSRTYFLPQAAFCLTSCLLATGRAGSLWEECRLGVQ